MEQKELEYYLSQVRRIAEHREKGALLKIRKTFKALLRDLKHFVADEYADLAENDELTFEILNRKRQYARFIEETVKIIDSYYPDALKQTTDVVEQTYQLVYDGMIDSVEKCSTTAELDEAFKGVKAATPQQIRAAVMNPITKITVPDTYAKDRANYIYDLKRELNTGLLNGDRYSTMAKRIVDRTKIAYRRAECVVRTETHRVREQGFCDSAVEINQTLEQGETSMRMVKTWCTMEDERVRGGKKGQKANHRKMNGVSVPIDEKFDLGRGIKTMCPGSSGDAANDINCRCFLVHELKDMTGKESKKPVEEKSQLRKDIFSEETTANIQGELDKMDTDIAIKYKQTIEEAPKEYTTEGTAYNKNRNIINYNKDEVENMEGWVAVHETTHYKDFNTPMKYNVEYNIKERYLDDNGEIKIRNVKGVDTYDTRSASGYISYAYDSEQYSSDYKILKEKIGLTSDDFETNASNFREWRKEQRTKYNTNDMNNVYDVISSYVEWEMPVSLLEAGHDKSYWEETSEHQYSECIAAYSILNATKSDALSLMKELVPNICKHLEVVFKEMWK